MEADLKYWTQLIHNRSVDYIAMDIKTDPSAYPREILHNENTANILESIALIMAAGISYEFRTTCVKPFVDRPIIEKISHTIQGADVTPCNGSRMRTYCLLSFFRIYQRTIHSRNLKRFRPSQPPGWWNALFVNKHPPLFGSPVSKSRDIYRND